MPAEDDELAEKRKARRDVIKALGLGGVSLAALLSSRNVLADYPQNSPTVIEQGSLVNTAEYVIFKDGDLIKARNGYTGQIEFSNADAASLINAVLTKIGPGGMAGLPANGRIVVKAGTYDISSAILLNQAGVTLEGEGHGSVLRTTNGSSILYKDNSSKLSKSLAQPKVRNLTFDGNGVGIDLDMVPDSLLKLHSDLEISGCKFLGSGTGVRLIGADAASITNCLFYSATGIYLRRSINPVVSNSQFYDNAVGIFYDGEDPNDGYNGGLCVHQATMLGVGEAIKVQYCDWLNISSSVIDYCDKPLQIYGQDEGNIMNNFITSRPTWGITPLQVNPAIVVAPGAAYPTEPSRHIKIIANQFITHGDDVAKVYAPTAVSLDTTTSCLISENTIGNWAQYGIHYKKSVRLSIVLNTISPQPGYGLYSIFVDDTEGDDSSNLIIGNSLDKSIRVIYARTDMNLGANLKNTNHGNATLALGATSVVVKHGLGSAPASVLVTPTLNTSFWVESIDSQSFTIRIPNALVSPVGFYWFAFTNFSFLQGT